VNQEAALNSSQDRKADRVLTHCLYRIATGKWGPGEKLPSVRAAEREWEVDRRTVLEAYRRLEESGLVTCADRAGYFVAKGSELGRISKHREVLSKLFARWQKELLTETGLSPLGTFRYFAQLAAMQAAESPDCAFVECTSTQAQGHCEEITRRLGVPVIPLTLDAIESGAKLPPSLRTLLVSSFHLGDLRSLKRPKKLSTLPVPIEVAPPNLPKRSKQKPSAVLFEADDEQAHDIADDLRSLHPGLKLRSKVIANSSPDGLEEAVKSWQQKAPANQFVLLSPRLWGRLPAKLQSNRRLREVTFRIREEAWPKIADSIGLPLGVLGSG
jgi:DNA-binding transcriptional regulator YhcF (GntR family)